MSVQSRGEAVKWQQAPGRGVCLPKCSLSPPICLHAGDDLPPEAHAVSSGYDAISMRRTCREHGRGAAGLHLVSPLLQHPCCPPLRDPRPMTHLHLRESEHTILWVLGAVVASFVPPVTPMQSRRPALLSSSHSDTVL